MFKKLNTKTYNNQQEDFTTFEKIANLKKIPNYKRANAGENNDFQFHDMEEIAINHNCDKKRYSTIYSKNLIPKTLLFQLSLSSTKTSNKLLPL
jgi:hypothetical protein